MASLHRRRNQDGYISWDATVRGYPTACKSFPTKLEAERWAAREARVASRTLSLAR